ncbi:MAG: hypothetical protein U5K77_03710 [Candidatus Saccharibacteria bacterium]|nr:hypothetical protein [Candidatus Saccharibacteria bacterium]
MSEKELFDLVEYFKNVDNRVHETDLNEGQHYWLTELLGNNKLRINPDECVSRTLTIIRSVKVLQNEIFDVEFSMIEPDQEGSMSLNFQMKDGLFVPNENCKITNAGLNICEAYFIPVEEA